MCFSFLKMRVNVRVVPLAGFPVCYCGRDGGRRAGAGEVCVVCCVQADPTESDTLLAELSVF